MGIRRAVFERVNSEGWPCPLKTESKQMPTSAVYRLSTSHASIMPSPGPVILITGANRFAMYLLVVFAFIRLVLLLLSLAVLFCHSFHLRHPISGVGEALSARLLDIHAAAQSDLTLILACRTRSKAEQVSNTFNQSTLLSSYSSPTLDQARAPGHVSKGHGRYPDRRRQQLRVCDQRNGDLQGEVRCSFTASFLSSHAQQQ